MKLVDRLSRGILDILVTVVSAGIAATLTVLIFQGQIMPLAYIWLASVILTVVLAVRLYQAYTGRPFATRYRDEREALSAIRELVVGTQRRLRILSKVGTSVFFSFREFSKILEQGRKIQVLIADPDDLSLMSLMDRIYVNQEKMADRWARMISEMQAEANTLFSEGCIPQDANNSLTSMLSASTGYKDLIMASVYMWNLAQQMATERLNEHENTIHQEVRGLDILVYSDLPDIKAWIADDHACALGYYDALHLGRENPIDLYRPRSHHDVELWQLHNVISVWEHKHKGSRRIDLATIPELPNDPR